MGKALRGSGEDRGRRGGAVRTAAGLLLALGLLAARPLGAQDAPERLDRGRFTVLHFPRDAQLAASLAAHAIATDTFPGLPRSPQRVVIAIAPDARRFREWAGDAPEWGTAVAFPESRRIVLQGQRAGSDAGDPLVVLRHELAHLALHEYIGGRAPRWFDEGYASYAAGEWGREEVLTTNVALALGGMPTLDELESSFGGGSSAAQSAYALAHRAVVELAQLDRERGLSIFFRQWRATGSMERALRAAYGLTSAGFEKHWRERTRRQYGALALVGNLALAGLLVLFVLVPLYFIRKRRDRERLDRMRRAEAAAEEAARISALEALLGPTAPEEPR